MKILQLAKLCPPCEGGIDIYSYDLTEELYKLGVDVDIICFSNVTKKESKGFTQFSTKINAKIHSALISWDLIKIFLKIRKNYDILHVHVPNPLLEILTFFFDKRIVIHWHSDVVRQKMAYWLYKPLQKQMLKRADVIICTSSQYKATSKILKPFQDKIEIIPLGINPDRLTQLTSIDDNYLKLLEKAKGKKIVLSIGRLVTYKGFEYLIEAALYLPDDTIIWIAGGGPLYKRLSKKIKQLKLENKVLLLGKVKNIGEYLRRCDVFCLPSISRNEAFGLVLIEALFFGKPLVTTNVEGSGMSFVNLDGITGYIVPPKNPQRLAEAISKILNDQNLLKSFSENAKQRFQEFHIRVSAQKIIELYRKLSTR